MRIQSITSSFSHRVIFVSALILTNVVTAVTVHYADPGSIPVFRGHYPHIDPARAFVSEEDLFTTVQPLREELQDIAEEYEKEVGSISLYVEFLNTGANISINPDTYNAPANLPTLPLAMAVLKKVEEGTWALSNELVLMDRDRDTESGSAGDPIGRYPVGTRFTIEQLLEAHITNVDMTAHHILARNMHEDELRNLFSAIGLSKLFDDTGRLSAKEYSRFFRSLYTASFLSVEHSERVLDWLDERDSDVYLATGLAPNVLFTHIHGEDSARRAYADSGIVYVPGRPYLITVIVEGDEGLPLEIDRERAQRFMQDVSAAAFRHFTQP